MGDGATVTVTVEQTEDGHLGFSVRGGLEHGLNIFISKVEPHSPAEQAGLCVGDKLLEVNGISLENISISSAVKVLTGHRRLRLVLQRVGWVPGVRLANEKTTWVDLIHRRLVVEEGGISLSDGRLDSALCRTVRLQTSLSQPCLGLNIRGGNEYGLGIYVSKVDPGGLAEQGGVKMGDQILSANGVSFDDVTHSRAVEVLKCQSHVTLIIKETGRFPAYQEIVAKSSFVDTRSSGVYDSVSRGSDSSCASSLSSGTPLSSVTGVSQATLPVCLPFGDQLANISSFSEPTASAGHVAQQNTSLNRGPTELLHDAAIRAEEEEGGGEERGEGRKTSVLMALSRPRLPICRTQSHMTVSEKQQRTQKSSQAERGDRAPPHHSTTFLGLSWMREYSRSPDRSSTRSEPGTDQPGDVGLQGTGDVGLQGTGDVYQENHLLEEVEQLCVTRQPGDVPEPSRTFPPLLDIPVDSVRATPTDSPRPMKTTPTLPNWLLTEKTHSPHATEGATGCSDGDFSHLENNGQPESLANRKETNKQNVFFTIVDTPRPRRPLLSQVFGPLKRSQSTGVPPTGRSRQNRAQEHVQSSSVSDHHSDETDQEYELKTVTISKTKQSLGISISGGLESSVQSVVKIEKIFPGGAASTNESLKAGFELLSVDGVSLQHITHQDAVEVIRQAFNNKSTDPMKLVVKVPLHL